MTRASRGWPVVGRFLGRRHRGECRRAALRPHARRGCLSGAARMRHRLAAQWAMRAAASWRTTSPALAVRCAAPGCRSTAARIALAQQALPCWWAWPGTTSAAALEAVLVSREQDRQVFRELFDAYFRNPDVGQQAAGADAAQCPRGQRPSPRVARACAMRCRRRSRLRQSRQHQRRRQEIEFDAAMTASDLERLRHADFNQLSCHRIPAGATLGARHGAARAACASRRTAPAAVVQPCTGPWCDAPCAAQTGGEMLQLRRLQRRASRCPCWCWWTCRARWSAMHACCWPSCTPPRAGAAGRGRDVCSRLAPA
jgi:hypothetical protein